MRLAGLEIPEIALTAFHQAYETVEQVVTVLRTRGSFRMVLYTEDGSVAERDAFKRAVEERHMGYLDIIRQRIGHDDESVVLTGNLDLAGLHVFNRMIGTSVAVMHFLSRRTQSQRQHLMAEADSEDRQPRFENRFEVVPSLVSEEA